MLSFNAGALGKPDNIHRCDKGSGGIFIFLTGFGAKISYVEFLYFFDVFSPYSDVFDFHDYFSVVDWLYGKRNDSIRAAYRLKLAITINFSFFFVKNILR